MTGRGLVRAQPNTPSHHFGEELTVHTPGKTTKRTIIAATAILATSLLAACGGGSSGTANKDTGQATGNITFWSWTPGLDPIIKTFENSHPGIKVTVVNAGQGAAEYAKLRTAIKAGSGAPDVAAIEYQYIPTFVNDLVDLNQYGAADLKSKYVDWAWAQAGQNGKQLGMPWDTAPMCVVYRADIFEKYGIQVPKTWDEFAAAARKLHAAAPNVYLTNLAANDWERALDDLQTVQKKLDAIKNDKDMSAALKQKLMAIKPQVAVVNTQIQRHDKAAVRSTVILLNDFTKVMDDPAMMAWLGNRGGGAGR